MSRPTKPRPKRATIQDIAASLQLSAMTVSRAMLGRSEISEETKRKVLERAREMNYRPNRWARSLVTQKSLVIGLVVPDISHAFFADIAAGAQEVLEQKGYNLLLCRSNRDSQTELNEIDMLLDSRVAGLIVASEQPETSWQPFGRLKSEGVHFVLIDRTFEGLACDSLTTDDHEVGVLATAHLAEIGHRAIAHVRGPATSTARQRIEGYRQVLQQYGFGENPNWIVPGEFRLDESREAALRLMRETPRPTAIFAASDLSAFGVVAGCRAAGFQVPEDVSVVGVGNIEGDQHPNPFLTTIDWLRREMGREAARVLLQRIGEDRPGAPGVHVFPPRLLVRHSTRPAA
jgi:LacI family transcriptional regulator